MPKSPRKETYRVTITRPETMTVTEVKKLILDGFQLAHVSAKVELVRGGSAEPDKQSFWARLFS